jgi:hypothetical protein
VAALRDASALSKNIEQSSLRPGFSVADRDERIEKGIGSANHSHHCQIHNNRQIYLSNKWLLLGFLPEKKITVMFMFSMMQNYQGGPKVIVNEKFRPLNQPRKLPKPGFDQLLNFSTLTAILLCVGGLFVGMLEWAGVKR